jgi:DNA-directed RNA polymerase
MHDKLRLEDLRDMQVELPTVEDDPLYARQLELEELMLAKGEEQMQAAIRKAKLKGNVAHLEPYRMLTETLMAPLTSGIDTYLMQEEASRNKTKAAKLLRKVSSGTAALIVLRNLLDDSERFGSQEIPGLPRLLALAKGTGRMVESEARMEAWSKKKPALWKRVQRGLTDQGATTLHRRRTNINRFNTLVYDEIGWKDWTPQDHLHVGLALVKLMCETSGGRIQCIPDPNHQRQSGSDSPPWVVTLDEDTLSWLHHALAKMGFTNPVWMPMVMMPAPWSGMWDGGYLTGILPRRSLIRFKADNVEQAKVAVHELDHVAMPGVYDAINTLQETAWKINPAVYAVARQVWDKDLAIAGVPSQKLKVKPPRPAAAKLIPEIDREWKKQATAINASNALLASRVKKASRVMDIAAIYADEERFYFPHVLDFRGRAYPIPVDLQPQGEDIARGLLTFAEGKPLGERGAYWLAIHVANCWGQGKSFESRLRWVEKNRTMLLRVGSDPMKHRQWAALKKDNWQALAAAIEWANYLEHGEGYVSSLPIRMDGTCNGIQHLSAMVRDEEGGASVNLTPGDAPRDIYIEVAHMVETHLMQLTEADNADERVLATRWINALGGVVPREMTKRPVMILPYGGTQRAYQKYTEEWMAEHDPEHTIWPGHPKNREASQEQRERFFKEVNFLVKLLWDRVEAKLPRAREVQQWLQKCARLAAATNLPLRWVTPMGFVVRHFYGQKMGTTIESKIDGQRIQLRDWTRSKNMDVADQMKGIPPNFTHSQDGSCLMMTVNMAYNCDIMAITTIHDCFGCVAADMDTLQGLIREAFVRNYSVDVLEEFRRSCMEVIDDDLDLIMAMPKRPKFGTLDIEQVRQSPYMFH